MSTGSRPTNRCLSLPQADNSNTEAARPAGATHAIPSGIAIVARTSQTSNAVLERLHTTHVRVPTSAKPFSEQKRPAGFRLPILGNIPQPGTFRDGSPGPSTEEFLEYIRNRRSGLPHHPYECPRCQIAFAFKSDLIMHQTAAAKGFCGFAFLHSSDLCSPQSDGASGCAGHHPPPPGKTSLPSDYDTMLGMLRDWEACQVLAYRGTSRSGGSGEGKTPTRSSFRDSDSDRTLRPSRLSVQNTETFHSARPVSQYEERETDLGAPAALVCHPGFPLTGISGEKRSRVSGRPDSPTLGNGAAMALINQRT